MLFGTRSSNRVVLEGRGKLNLDAVDHVATGGEGSIYRKGDTAIKVYTDPARFTRDGLADKLRLLSRLTHPFIVAPKGLVLDSTQTPIGCWMTFAEGEALSRLFTTEFRARIGFDDAATDTLADGMRAAVAAAHAGGAILVDGNELNYLAALGGANGPQPRLIDVDAWAIGPYGATVIMPSIRDWHTQGFDQGSDWFAWAIVSFQLYTGIHPYKGTAPGFARGDLEGRMRANVSVFHSGVRLNRVVRDPAGIPAPLRTWYEDVFEHGRRTPPPSPYARTVTMPAPRLQPIVTAVGSGDLVLEKLLERSGDAVVEVFACGVARLASGALVDLATGRALLQAAGPLAGIIATGDGWLLSEAGAFRHVARDGTTTEVASPLTTGRVLSAAGRLLVAADALTDLQVRVLAGKLILSAGNRWGFLPHATRWFDGLGVQDTLGAPWLIVPFGARACAQLPVPELAGLIPLNGLAGPRYAAIVAQDPTGAQQRLELVFDVEHRTYQATRTAVDNADLNLAILPRGVCASIIDDGEMRIFVPATGTCRIVKDGAISTAMRLSAWNESVVAIKDGALWRLRLR